VSDDFLSRWSRRKIEVKEAEAKEASPVPAEEPASAVELDPQVASDGVEVAPPAAGDLLVSAQEITPEEIAALPPIEDLTSNTDLAPFLQAGVPALLRNAALRRMWTIDPGIRDFLNDAREYAYDWNAPGGVPGLGPLLPCDDVQAMVRQVFDGRARPGPQEIASAAEEPVDQEAADAQDPSAPDLIGEEAVQIAPAQSDTMFAAEILAEADIASGEENPETPVEEALEPSLRRPRRHGGATPA
jgi:hypothetical protein